VAGTLK